MRIHLKLTPNIEPVPFTYQEQLTGKLHKWLKDARMHEGASLYSFSNLKNGKMKNEKLEFKFDPYFFISCWDKKLLQRLVSSIREEPDIAFGMVVKEIIIQEDPDLTNMEYFRVASPILIHRTVDNKPEYFFYDDENAGELLVETTKTKMSHAKLEFDKTMKIEFDKNYNRAAKKRIFYKGVINPVSVCPVKIQGLNTTKQFIWNVGLGNSTGIGFGAIF